MTTRRSSGDALPRRLPGLVRKAAVESVLPAPLRAPQTFALGR